MKTRYGSTICILIGALALAGCGSEAPPAQEREAQAAEAPSADQPVMGPERRVLAFGDSLFAGYNVDAEDSYPAKLEAALRANGVNARVANAGVSGDTSSAGLQRFVFTLDAQGETPELVIIELGGNDLLRGLPPAQTRDNLDTMLAETQKRGIPTLLMGMRAPPNLGEAFVNDFDTIYPDLAKKYGAQLVPFFLESIYQRPELIQPDRIHPTEKGIEELVAATVANVREALPKAPAS
ncbi:arylesterase [Altererythrobacter sp. ZODW24]|uniref:arylesterase n=1 Tax=Altererythrobacter sp. ZODW24 TaxID=2185142 RepID=UPI0019658784|nr:arylesterase [Altererythrobacter sp. ZODW24]